MAKIGFSEAARLVGFSRQHLYRMAEGGQLSVTKELISGKSGEDPSHFRQFVDTAELQRVFGRLSGMDGDGDSNVTPGDALETQLAMARALLEDREAQLLEARERETWLRKQVDESQSLTKLLGHIAPADMVPREKHERICRNGQRKINELVEELEDLRNRGIFARLFNI